MENEKILSQPITHTPQKSSRHTYTSSLHRRSRVFGDRDHRQRATEKDIKMPQFFQSIVPEKVRLEIYSLGVEPVVPREDIYYMEHDNRRSNMGLDCALGPREQVRQRRFEKELRTSCTRSCNLFGNNTWDYFEDLRLSLLLSIDTCQYIRSMTVAILNARNVTECVLHDIVHEQTLMKQTALTPEGLRKISETDILCLP